MQHRCQLKVAYFTPTGRLWELGLGAIVAILALALVKIPAVVGRSSWWMGLLAILAAAAVCSANTPFPGAPALIPTVGPAAVIIAGLNGHDRYGAAGIPSTRSLKWIGDRSHSLYLTRWPFIVVTTYLMDGLSVLQGTLVVLAPMVPATLSYRYIELPFQR